MSLPDSHGLAMHLNYQQPSQCHQGHVQLHSQLNRSDVQFSAEILHPLPFRDAMAALFAVVSSDYRYVPKDRSAYAAYLQMRRGNQNQGLFAAQRAYFDWLYQNDPLAYCILDPVISVYADRVMLEVFSRDEGCYAALSLKPTLFATPDPAHTQYGTTHIDFSEALAGGIEQMRSFRQASLQVGQQASTLHVQTADAQPDQQIIEKKINVPTTWLRGFLQVQSAAQLSQDQVQLCPIDLYNALFHLRMHADQKGKRRGLLLELIPNQPPSLILEPSGTVISSADAPVYQGKQAKLIRLWGRRRLALLQRILPYAKQVTVRLLGNGMPSYWTIEAEHFSFTLAITGFSTANWSQALNFDLLMPRQVEHDANPIQQVVQYLQQHGAASIEQLHRALSESESLNLTDCRAAVQHACQQGLVMFDLAQQVYRYRPLTEQPLDMAHFRYRHPAEQQAYELLSRPNAISNLQIRVIPRDGIELSCEVTVSEDQRSYSSKLKLNEEGMVSKAECSCHAFLQHGLSQGPCSHLVALRMAYAAQQAERDPQQISQETRLFSRRHAQQVEQIQLTINQKRLWLQTDAGESSSTTPKRQQLAFNHVDAARQAYLDKISQLQRTGFIENTVD